jgi:poly(A) polymerase
MLQCVRLWATRRGLYSVNFGYFSGITLAVMAARVCQDNPESMPCCLLYKFFDKYAESDWREPVQLNLKQRAQGLQASYLNALD